MMVVVVIKDKKEYGMSNKRSKFKKYLAAIVLFCFIIYILLDFNIKTNLVNLKEHIVDFTSSSSLSSSNEKFRINVNHAYFVDTEGCKMPSFKVIDDRVAQFIFRPHKINCGKSLLIATDNNEIELNMNKFELYEFYNITNLDNIHCYYHEFIRKNDSINIYIKQKIFFNLFNKTKIESSEYIKVVCNYEIYGVFYIDFFAFPSNMKKIKKNQAQELNELQLHQKELIINNNNKQQDNKKISVIILGIDSVSRLNFLRQMNQTATLLRNKFDAFEFFGYNKVGDNTYPNLIPVLSGFDEMELNQACPSLKNNISYDDCPFIWKHYKDIGYETVFSEDSATIGLFNYFRKGFINEPTDYYTRPLFLEMEKIIARKLKSNFYLCLGNRRPLDVIFDYFKKFLKKIKKKSFFSLLWTSSSTHDFLNTPSSIDKDLMEFILTLNNSYDLFNRTALILMSDHGLRWGPFRKTYQGMIEERQPLLFIILPKWFPKTFPLAVANMRMNKHKLTSLFDLYATLLDLSDTSSITNRNIDERLTELKESDSLPRAISLFLSIPELRTCEMAGIASHWCTCHEKRTLPTNSPRVQHAARFIVKQINKKLEMHPQCRVLYLNSIMEANISSANKVIQKEAKDLDFLVDITVRLQTKPGLGEFESTVRLSNSDAILTGTISRINLYRTQSYCIDDYSLKMYCYCKR